MFYAHVSCVCVVALASTNPHSPSRFTVAVVILVLILVRALLYLGVRATEGIRGDAMCGFSFHFHVSLTIGPCPSYTVYM